ncbi:MAG: response regulator transcription factor [Brumimicrobium sp.]
MTDKLNKILLVEDEESLSKVVALNLRLEGFDVTCVSNGREAISFKDKVHTFDLIILDVMLPEVSGWDICTAYKSVANTPILFVSAKGSSADKIKGLKLGADDYLAKPFDLEELLLRVQVLILRHAENKNKPNSLLTIGEFEINTITYEVYRSGKQVEELSKREIELLQLFKDHENEVVSRDFILDQLWGKDNFPTTRTIDNYILSFRKLFEIDPKNPKHFHSIRGVGYKFTNR